MTKFLIFIQLLIGVSSFIYVPAKAIKSSIEIRYSVENAPKDNDESTQISKNDNKKYYGVYVSDPQEVIAFKKSNNILAWFDTFEKASDTKIAMCLDQHQYTAFITLEPKNMELKNLANGDYDSQIIEYLQKLSSGDRINTKLYIRFAHEMEMRPSYAKNWYGWQSYDSDTYVEAWRHVVNLSKIHAPNIYWVWSPNRADLFTYSYYPGEDYVDCVSLTLNNTTDSYKTFAEFYEDNHQKEYLESYHKPIFFGEVAEHSLDNEQKTRYLSSIFDYVQNYDKAIGVVFLNKNIDEYRKYRFSDDCDQLNLFIDRALEEK